MLKKSTLSIMRTIANSEETRVEKLLALLDMNKKQFWYELSVLNDELLLHGIEPIEQEKAQIVFKSDQRKQMKKLIVEQTIDLYRYQEERIYFLYLYLACKQGFLSNIHLQEFLQMSRNAVMLDLKRLRKWIKPYQLMIKYDRIEGYLLMGNERDIRKVMEVSLSKLKKYFSLENVLLVFEREWEKKIDINKVNHCVMKISQEHHLNMVQDRMEEFIYLILFMQNRTCKVELEFSEREERLLGNQWLYPISEKLVQAVFNSGEECEVYFWESRLLGIVQGESSFSDQEFFNTLTEQVLMNAQVLVGLDYSESKELKETLYQHIVPAYFRIIFDVYYENPLLEKVKKEYRELFEITRRALQPLEKEVNRKISESEIAYFTIHFGGYLKRKAEPDRIKAAVVCPNGISSSLIMASTIRETFPELEIIRVHSIDTMKDTVLHDIEIVFSTTYFSTEKAIYVTNPILNPVEKEILREQVSSDFPSLPKPQPILTSDVLKIMEKHGTITNKQALIQELQHYLYRTNRVEEKGMKNLPDILDESLIQVTDEKMEWKGAIEKAAQPLLKQGYIEEAYVEAMIETVESIGPYIVLAPKVAVPHARPERGVKQLGISLLKLSEPVDFNVIGEEDPERYVQLVFVLAAVDGEAHLKALMQLSRILEDEDHIEALIQLDEPKELYNKIQHLVETEGGA
jgi:PTS system ascorbate-specific IIA component